MATINIDSLGAQGFVTVSGKEWAENLAVYDPQRLVMALASLGPDTYITGVSSNIHEILQEQVTRIKQGYPRKYFWASWHSGEAFKDMDSCVDYLNYCYQLSDALRKDA